MKKANHYIVLITALLFIPFLQSCNDDDDSGSGPTPTTFTHTISFSHFENIEFRMWTNGAEVNTAGLNFADFVEDGEENSLLIPELHESEVGLTFTEDSVFALFPKWVNAIGSLLDFQRFDFSSNSIYLSH